MFNFFQNRKERLKLKKLQDLSDSVLINFNENFIDYLEDNVVDFLKSKDIYISPIHKNEDPKIIYKYNLPDNIRQDQIDELFEKTLEFDEALEYFYSYDEDNWNIQLYINIQERIVIEIRFNGIEKTLCLIFRFGEEDDIKKFEESNKFIDKTFMGKGITIDSKEFFINNSIKIKGEGLFIIDESYMSYLPLSFSEIIKMEWEKNNNINDNLNLEVNSSKLFEFEKFIYSLKNKFQFIWINPRQSQILLFNRYELPLSNKIEK